MKMWMKTGNPVKYRMEISAEGMMTTLIYDGQNYYMMSDASEGIAFMMSAAQFEQYAPASADDSSLAQYSPVLDGSEVVNGVDCYIYKYTVDGVVSRIWLSKANGLPIRETAGTTTIDYTNYKFDMIPDSQFTLPPGVTPMTMPAIPGM
jgi:hypothetical protein